MDKDDLQSWQKAGHTVQNQQPAQATTRPKKFLDKRYREQQAQTTEYPSASRHFTNANIPSACIPSDGENATLISNIGNINIPSGAIAGSVVPENGECNVTYHALDDSDTRTQTVRFDSGRLKKCTEDSKPSEDRRTESLEFLRDFYERRMKYAEEMSLEDLLDFTENARAQDAGWKRGRPKVPTTPLWKNPGIHRGAVLSMPVVQHAYDPNSKEDRRRFITYTGFVDASFRLVVIQGVFRTHIVASIVTTRGGKGSNTKYMSEKDRRWWGALREIGNPKMRDECVNRTFDMNTQASRKNSLHPGAIFRLHGTPMSLPAEYVYVGRLTKEGFPFLPMPEGCDDKGWELDYESVVPSFTLETQRYIDLDGSPPRGEAPLEYDEQFPQQGSSKRRSSLEEGEVMSHDHNVPCNYLDADSALQKDVHDRGRALEDKKDHLRHHTRKRSRSPESDNAAARQSHKKHRDAFGKPGKCTKEHVYESANEDETPASGRSPFARSERSNRRTDDYRSKNRTYGGADSGRHYRRRDRDSRGGGH